jgi:type III HopA1-like effector protein
MTTNVQQEITPILEAIKVQSPAAFLFRNEVVQVAPEPVQPLAGLPAHPLPQVPLVRHLQSVLYARCYMRRFEEPQLATITPATPDPTFVHRLSEANSSVQRWENGWAIYALGQNGQVWLQKGDRQRSAVAGEYITSGVPGMPPQVGSVVAVLSPRESMIAQPGFYYIYGETLSDAWDEHALLRFYFHSPAESAPDLLHYLIANLNRYQVPFRMKALVEPAMYQRSDAVVLYMAKRYYDISVRIIRGMPRDVAANLRPSTPLFTRTVQPGVGTSEDPGNNESFGMHRCRMFAEGIVDAWMAGDQSVEGRLQAIGARFAAGGFQLNLPHLSPGSIDFHEVPTEIDFAYA